eukprot:Phypoly_transcript_16442.p1 GENE.Phypoly_transcript_16442~~Phypoly_transcript_16442.p1  ORF type:complete len:183 (+),score=22.35 Phypoly_transcript_16442:264-812(+)
MKASLILLSLALSMVLAMDMGMPGKQQNVSLPTASWTMFKQCDSRWGSQELGSCSQTVCTAGCAMSCVAMLLATKGWNGNPGVLNEWLKGHGGYADGCEIDWPVVDQLGYTSCLGHEKQAYHTFCDMLGQGRAIVLNVRSGTHWVLATGCPGNNVFSVNDPYFDVGTYTLSDVVDAVAYAFK